MNLYQINIIIYSFGFKISAIAMVKVGCRYFRDVPTQEIRNYFLILESMGHGTTRGADDNLKFSAK